MKAFILAFVLFYTCSAFKHNVHPDLVKSWDKMVGRHRERCIAETKVDKEDAMGAVLAMDLPEYYEYKCFAYCIWRESEFYNPQTKQLNYANIVRGVTGFTKENTKQCYKKYKNTGDHCERIYGIVTCGIGKLSF
ncbi:hypothetical protein PPYR_09092 [Photinus pyralis]|uniref:Uncharacterized protein n=1 Tax=Photinus pyralis TaxID=7054 RepID=A0A5N4ALA1_PHOPY|nr:hypothetical protein PPYR_09092 [Photinus pyralis]